MITVATRRKLQRADWARRLLVEEWHRDLVLHSGRGTGKDTETCRYVIGRMRRERGFRAVFMRQFQASIRDSVKALFERQLRELGCAGEFRVTDQHITHKRTGAYAWFIGFDRNPSALLGLDDVDVAVVNEAATLREEADLLFHYSIRKDNSRVIYIGNPRLETDYFTRLVRGEARPGAMRFKVERWMNPQFPAVLEQDRLADVGKPWYAHVWEGETIGLIGRMFDATRVLEQPDWHHDSVRRVRAWDTAGTEGGGDWTVGLRLAEWNGAFRIEDVQRGQWSPEGVEDAIAATAHADGGAVAIRIEHGAAASGKQEARQWGRVLVGYDVASTHVTGRKADRARPAAAAMNNGLFCRPPQASWWYDLAAELAAFSEDVAQMRGRYDDQVDALSLAFNHLVSDGPFVISRGRAERNALLGKAIL